MGTRLPKKPYICSEINRNKDESGLRQAKYSFLQKPLDIFIKTPPLILHSMKKYLCAILVFLCTGVAVTSCQEEDTYAEKIKQQRNQISNFLKKGTLVKSSDGDTLLYVPGNIQVISESQFLAQDSTTNVSNNEYVLFGSTGIYMQIVRQGVGSRLAENTTTTILSRFTEYNISGDSLSMSSMSSMYSTAPDVMSCTNSYGTISGNLLSGALYNLLASSSTSVPTGWLKPLEYVYIGRATTPDEEISKVRLIVPSTSGHGRAQNLNYASFYEITYQRARS